MTPRKLVPLVGSSLKNLVQGIEFGMKVLRKSWEVDVEVKNSVHVHFSLASFWHNGCYCILCVNMKTINLFGRSRCSFRLVAHSQGVWVQYWNCWGCLHQILQ